MDFENFKEKFMEDIKDRLEDAGIDAKITTNTVKKLNESYEAVTITPNDSNLGMNLPVEKFFDAYDEGRPYDEVIDKAMEVIENGMNERPDFNIDDLTDYSKMKETLAMEVVSAEANKEMLETVPHKMMEDMAVVYRFVLSSDEDGRASVLVTNQMIENMGITAEQLHADAMENAPQLKPAEIKGMTEVLAELMGVEQAEMMGMAPVAPEDEQIFVATVSDKIHVASVIAYANFMEDASQKMGDDLFVLSNSIHEVLLVRDNGQMTAK